MGLGRDITASGFSSWYHLNQLGSCHQVMQRAAAQTHDSRMPCEGTFSNSLSLLSEEPEAMRRIFPSQLFLYSETQVVPEKQVAAYVSPVLNFRVKYCASPAPW